MPRQSILWIPHLLREAGLVPGSRDRDSPARLSFLQHCHGQGMAVDTIPPPEPHTLPVPFFTPQIPLELISHSTQALWGGERAQIFNLAHTGGGSTQKLGWKAGERQQTCSPFPHQQPQFPPAPTGLDSGWILVSGSPACTFQQPQNSQPSLQQR